MALTISGQRADYTLMRCLYCGKQLALLKRLTGGGEFCSDAHKHSYQEEYNRLALSRLLQAQSKPGEIKTHASVPAPVEGLGQPLPPGASRRRALPASTPTPQPQRTAIPLGPVTAAPAAMAEPVQEAVEEVRPVAREEAPVAAIEETVPPEAEEVPPEFSVFSMEIPAFSALADEAPYVEPWLDAVAAPASPAWQASNQFSTLSLGTPLALEHPLADEIEFPALVAELAPVEFARAKVNLVGLSEHFFASAAPSRTVPEMESPFSSLPTAALMHLEICSAVDGARPAILEVAAAPTEFVNAKANLNVPFAVAAAPSGAFPAASPIALDIRVTASGASHQTSSNGALRFPVRVFFQDSSLLNLYPSGIDFPSEDSDVVLIAPWVDEMISHPNGLDSGGENAAAGVEAAGSPREALEALSRLHQDLALQHETAQAPAEATEAEVELAPAPLEQNSIAAAPVEPQAATIDISAEPVEDRPIPRSAHELLALPFKTFAPAKPALAVDSTALTSLSPELPRLKALPLRPKVGKAPPGFSPQQGAAQATEPAAESKPKAPAPQQRPEVRTAQVPLPAAKPPTPPVKSPPTVQSVKPGQASKPAQALKPAQPAKPPQTAKQAQPAPTAKPAGSSPQKPPRQPTPPAAQPAQPAAGDSKSQVPPPAAPGVPDHSSMSSDEVMPSFATVQPVKNLSFAGSLKGKLVIAISLVVIAGGAYLSMGGKSQRSAANSRTAEEGVGPSIMLGEGGWVQGWAGDPNGSHAGRQITIYRPSLKLSDYRIEFQGEIDSKSIGWVFRAMDPYNYYAMKLAIVTPGLSPKIALIKYAVVQGHETELGRVPVDMAARNDTVFNVRVDVRGAKFSTYVQGQPVDVWTDEQLKSGGVGFLNERAERARVKSASISYLTGGKN